MELHQKKEENVTEEDPAECGDCYTLTAMESGTRLWISHHEGDRTTDDATELFEDIERKRNSDSEIPLFISDDWDAFEEGLLNVYGKAEQPPYKGIGRKPNPVLVPGEDLKYAQVCKKRENGGVVGIVKRGVFGNLGDFLISSGRPKIHWKPEGTTSNPSNILKILLQNQGENHNILN